MPARMHSEYLRGLFLENRLTAGRFAVEGQVIALKDISVPMFVIGTEADHIAPWRSVYKIRLFTDCDLTFALTNAGHNGGILSEPGHAGRHYRMGRRKRGDFYMDPDSWFASHEPVDGSWWLELVKWMKNVSAQPVRTAEVLAKNGRRRALSEAPGEYVFQV